MKTIKKTASIYGDDEPKGRASLARCVAIWLIRPGQPEAVLAAFDTQGEAAALALAASFGIGIEPDGEGGYA